MPLDDVRGVAVSPDGEWLATSSHSIGGVRLWRTSDGTEVFKLPIEHGATVRFSADGRWLLTGASPCRLWAVGTWQEARQVGGAGLCFSADSRMVAVQDPSRIIRLVETTTGRTLARLESPDLCGAVHGNFSPDGSRLVVTTNEPRGAVHVWDLRAIRKHLTEMGLDWDAPAYSEDDPAGPTAPPFSRMEIDPLEYQFSEGAALAHRGRWDEAAAAYARGFDDGAPADAPRWFEQALLRLAVDDTAGYRSCCRQMLNVLGSRDELVWLEFTAHACVLAPAGPAETTEALRLAESAPALRLRPHGLSIYWAWPSTELAGLSRRKPCSGPASNVIRTGLGRSWTGWFSLWSKSGSADPTWPDAGWSRPRAGLRPTARPTRRCRSGHPRKLALACRHGPAPLAPRGPRHGPRRPPGAARRRVCQAAIANPARDDRKGKVLCKVQPDGAYRGYRPRDGQGTLRVARLSGLVLWDNR